MGYSEAMKNAFCTEGEAEITYGDVIAVKNRKYVYSSIGVDLIKLDKINGSFKCKLSIRSKCAKMSLQACVKAVYDYKGKECTGYAQGGHKAVENEWIELCSEFTMPDTVILKELKLYVHQRGNEELGDFEIKDVTVEDAPDVESLRPDIKGEKKTVGAIRWDAFFSTSSTESKVSREVARSLSPNQFHSHAPYFTNVTGKDAVEFGEATMAQFEEECLMAIDAGIDYFAYCWYRGNDPMRYARQQHRISKYNKQIKMCAIISVSSLRDEDVTELTENMAEDCYFKIDGHPLVYVFGALASKSALQNIKERAISLGCKKPVFISMGTCASIFDVYNVKRKGFDGLSAYSCFPYNDVEEYGDIVARNEERNNQRAEFEDILFNVPHVSMGLDFRPRALNPVSWMGGTKYALTGKPEEMYLHAKRTFELLDKTTLKTALIYAWNEHDEGGWICPTLSVEENGTVIKNADGTNKMDRSHLDAVKKAISEMKSNA